MRTTELNNNNDKVKDYNTSQCLWGVKYHTCGNLFPGKPVAGQWIVDY